SVRPVVRGFIAEQHVRSMFTDTSQICCWTPDVVFPRNPTKSALLRTFRGITSLHIIRCFAPTPCNDATADICSSAYQNPGGFSVPGCESAP
ncbi:TPA: hypothetical protein ACNCG0_004917, partial [Escherichia coli]